MPKTDFILPQLKLNKLQQAREYLRESRGALSANLAPYLAQKCLLLQITTKTASSYAAIQAVGER